MDVKQLVLLGVGIAASAVSAVWLYHYLTLPKYIENSDGNTYEPTSENIQVAIDDLGEKGGSVWLPPVAFYLQQGIIVRNNVSLYGYRGLTKFIFSNNIWITSETENSGLYDLCFTGAGAVRFSNCINAMIKNVKAENITFKTPAFSLINCQDSIIENCKSAYTLLYGAYLSNSEYCIVDNCDISYVPNSYTGIQILESNYNQISNNHVHHIGMNPDNMAEFDTEDRHGGPGIRAAGEGIGSHYNKFIYNHIHLIREHGIKTYPNCSNNEICYNKIDMCNMGNPTGSKSRSPYGWNLDMGGSSLIRGNEIGVNLAVRGGIVVHDDSAGATIEDNYIYHLGDGDRGHCLRIVSPNVIVKNNIFKGNGEFPMFHRAIHTQSINATIENNSMKGFTRGMGFTSADNAIVRYNLIKNCERGMQFIGGNGLTVTNNTFDCVPAIFEGEETLVNSIIEDNEIIPCR